MRATTITVLIFVGAFAWLGLSSRCARISKPRPERLHHEIVSEANRRLSQAAETVEARSVLLVRVYGLAAGIDHVRWQSPSEPVEVTLYDGDTFYGSPRLGKVLELVYAGSGSPLPSVDVNGLPVVFETSRGENLSYADNWSTSSEVSPASPPASGPLRWHRSNSAPDPDTLLGIGVDCILKRWKRTKDGRWTSVELSSK